MSSLSPPISYSIGVRAAVSVALYLSVTPQFVVSESHDIPPRSIAMMNITAEGIQEREINAFVDRMSFHIEDTRSLMIIDRLQREQALRESVFSDADAFDQESQLHMGRIIGADLIVLGTVNRIEERVATSLKLVDVGTGRTVTRFAADYDDMTQLLASSKTISLELTASTENTISARSGGAFEFGLGFAPYSWILSYVYQVNNWFGVGVSLTMQWYELFVGALRYEIPPVGWSYVSGIRYGIGPKLVFLDKVDGLAFSISYNVNPLGPDFRYLYPDYFSLAGDKVAEILDTEFTWLYYFIPRSLGVYYKNIYVNVLPALPIPGLDLWYFEIGYSVYFGE